MSNNETNNLFPNLGALKVQAMGAIGAFGTIKGNMILLKGKMILLLAINLSPILRFNTSRQFLKAQDEILSTIVGFYSFLIFGLKFIQYRGESMLY